MDWLDTTYSDPSVKAASVVTNLWIAGFAVCSACFAVLGTVVALQWPNPRVFCYKTSYSDMPSNSLRSCCSLYSLNLGFTVFWMLVFAIMVIARDIVRIIICLCFCLVHVMVVVIFRIKFKRYGRPERPFNASTELVAPSSVAATNLGPGQAVGIPVYNIPMQTVVIGSSARPGGDSGGAGGASGAAAGAAAPPPTYYYDADCVPPAQQHMQQPHAAAAGGAYVYPPQPLSPGAGGYVVGQPVTGIPAVAAPPVAAAAAPAVPAAAAPVPTLAPPPPVGGPAAPAAQQPARLSPDAGAGAAAGAATAAGAGAAVGRHPQPQQ